MNSKSIVGLDLIRFGAAAMVMWFHLAFWSWAPPTGDARTVTGGILRFPELTHSAWFGWVGVEVFFVLSGFVIANSAAHATSGAFLRARALRLLPAAWICGSITLLTLLYVGVYPAGSTALRYLRTLVLWPVGPWIDDVYWTLPIELAFYGVVFLVLLLKRWSAMRFVLACIGMVSSTFWFAEAIAWVASGAGELPLFASINPRLLELLLIQHGCFFALGALFWLVMEKRVGRRWWAIIAICAAGGFCEILLPAMPRARFLGNAALALAPVAIWLGSLVLIAASVRWNGVGWLRNHAGLARRIGLATYPLYLLHDVVGAAVMKRLFLVTDNRWVALGGSMVFICLISWVVANHAERLLRERLRACFRFPHR